MESEYRISSIVLNGTRRQGNVCGAVAGFTTPV